MTHEPLKTIPATECRQPATEERAECPQCQKTFLASAIANGAMTSTEDFPSIRTRHRGNMIHRYLYCDHCDVIYDWLQACTADGEPILGALLDGPGVIRNGPTINRLLLAHPQAAGVEQAT